MYAHVPFLMVTEVAKLVTATSTALLPALSVVRESTVDTLQMVPLYGEPNVSVNVPLIV